MHELVIVVSDLYVSQEAPERELPEGIALPGLQHVARFGTRERIPNGWRPWLARWLTGHDMGPPATVAAAALTYDGQGPETHSSAAASMVWMATPVYLIAGLTSLHLDRRSILRLSSEDRRTLALDFQHVFHDSGFTLRSLSSGDFLLFGPRRPAAEVSEPARLMGQSIADAQHVGTADPLLRRLSAEMEMWLHDNTLNVARQRRGEAPVTGLWIWGGGPVSAASAVSLSDSDLAFGCDAYLQGLWAASPERMLPVPEQLADVFSYPQAGRVTVAPDIGSLLQSHSWTFFDAVAHIDRAFIAPAVAALNQGRLQRLVILANDYQWALRARDRFKFWRRKVPGLSGLQ